LGFEAVSKIVRRQKMVEVMEAERVIFTVVFRVSNAKDTSFATTGITYY
jgi:hypothetical protein